jgi:hypothetical protein
VGGKDNPAPHGRLYLFLDPRLLIGNKNNQLSAYEYHEDEILQGSLSGAYDTFFCHNKHNPRDNAVMKVIMQ